MPVNTRELVEAISVIADNHNIRVTIKSSLEASCTAAAASFVGGMLFGPVGISVGATIGGLLAFIQSKERFKSVGDIIRYELSAKQKRKLCQHIIDAFKIVRAEEIAWLIYLITTPGESQTTAIKNVIKFFVEEMHMVVID